MAYWQLKDKKAACADRTTAAGLKDEDAVEALKKNCK